MSEKAEIVQISCFDDLLNFTKRLFENIGDYGQYTKAIALLQKLREEYRFWMSEKYRVDLHLTLPQSSSTPSPLHIILVKKRDKP